MRLGRYGGQPGLRVGALALTLAGASTLAGCGGGRPDIVTAAVVRQDVTAVVNAPGTVAARAQATLTAPTDATVAQVLVTDGQPVKAGDVVLRLGSPAAQARLAAARDADAKAAAGVTQAGRTGSTGGGARLAGDLRALQGQVDEATEAALTNARAAATTAPDPAVRAQVLAQVDEAQRRYAAARRASLDTLAALQSTVASGGAGIAGALTSVAQAQRAQTQAALALAQRTVDSLTVTSPITGTVQLGGGQGAAAGGAGVDLSALPQQAQQALGSLVGGGAGGGAAGAGATAPVVVAGVPVATGAQLATVYDLSALSVLAEVDETDVLAVHAGTAADLTLDAVPDAAYSAVVAAVDLAPSQSARGGTSYRVRLDLGPGTQPDGDGTTAAPRPRPGMSATVDLRTRTETGVLAVPASAVVHDGPATYVWRAVAGKARRTTVTTGVEGPELVAVRGGGLAAGDAVVVKGADQVRGGAALPAPPRP